MEKFEIKKNSLSGKLMALDKTITHHEDNPLSLHGYLTWVIVGRTGTGKSSLLMNALRHVYIKHFDNIFMVSPTSKFDPKMKKLSDELDVDGKLYTELNNDTVGEIIDRIEQSNEEIKEEEKRNAKNLVILDDCLHMFPKSHEKGSRLNELITTSRHRKTMLIITSQKWNSLSTLVRTNCAMISFFGSDSRQEVNTLIDDVNIDPKLFAELLHFSTSEKHSFIHISFLFPKPIFYKKFDRIILNREK